METNNRPFRQTPEYIRALLAAQLQRARMRHRVGTLDNVGSAPRRLRSRVFNACEVQP